MEKVANFGIRLRVLFFVIAIIVTIILCCMGKGTKGEEKINLAVILWPPDLVPHPPHFPQPKDPQEGGGRA